MPFKPWTHKERVYLAAAFICVAYTGKAMHRLAHLCTYLLLYCFWSFDILFSFLFRVFYLLVDLNFCTPGQIWDLPLPWRQDSQKLMRFNPPYLKLVSHFVERAATEPQVPQPSSILPSSIFNSFLMATDVSFWFIAEPWSHYHFVSDLHQSGLHQTHAATTGHIIASLIIETSLYHVVVSYTQTPNRRWQLAP